MADLVPVRKIDRDALERIIQRAAELQTSEREIGENLTPTEVLALGKEVGIPDRYLQQAMLEEQTRRPAAPTSGLWNRLAGPLVVTAERVVRGSIEDLEAALSRWMEQNELLTVQRHQRGWITWEPVGGFQAAIRRSSAALGGGKRPFMLSKASIVSATVTPLEEGYCLVGLEASLRRERGSHIAAGSVFSAAGIAGTAILAALGAIWAVAPLPLLAGLAIGYGVFRGYRPIAERTKLGLERVLDHLERGEVKPAHRLPEGGNRVWEVLAHEVRKALKP
jgi:hypothetical protein